MSIIRIVEEPIDLEAVMRQVIAPQCGGVGVFLGVVREPNLGHRTQHIDYHSYPEMAEKVMAEIAGEAAARWEVKEVAILHRVGRLQVGETSVAVVVSAAHRRDALEATSYLIEALKARVPIWKKEVFAGGELWIEGDVAAAPPRMLPVRPTGGETGRG